MRETQHVNPTVHPLTRQTPCPMMILNSKGNIVSWNRGAEIAFGYTEIELEGNPPPFIVKDYTNTFKDRWLNILQSEVPIQLNNILLQKKKGDPIQISLILNTLSINDESFVHCQFLLVEEEAVDFVLNEISNIHEYLDSTFMLAALDQEGLITYANPLFLKQSKWTPKRILGKSFWQLFPSDSKKTEFANNIWKTLEMGNQWHGEAEKITKDGQHYWVDLTAIPLKNAKGPSHYILLENNISDKKQLQERLEKFAYIDQETGLMNRNRLEQVVESMIEERNHFSLVYFSIDKFYSLKEIYNDQADRIALQEFTQRLKKYFQDSVIARVSMDEFVVLTPLGEWFIQGFLSYLEQHPIYINHGAFPISISGGISKYPNDQISFSHLMKASYTALKKIQAEGGAQIGSLSTADHKALYTKSIIEKRLLVALNQQDLKVSYQPQLDLNTGEIIAVEAFVRWDDKEIGTVAPDVLIPIAEETGLINNIGTFMLEQVCMQAAQWKESGLNIKASINLSVREFRDKNMAKQISSILERTNCPAELLQIEITEKFALEAEAEKSIIKQMKQLHNDGVRFVLDDFGTGYASFRYMQMLPLSQFKIDQTFISSMPYQPKTQKLVNGMIQFGKSIHMGVLAEGVETEEQKELLAEYGCDAIQGYLVGYPMDADDIEKLF